jgi:hypothetical protein
MILALKLLGFSFCSVAFGRLATAQRCCLLKSAFIRWRWLVHWARIEMKNAN